jgi:hypothetical protein
VFPLSRRIDSQFRLWFRLRLVCGAPIETGVRNAPVPLHTHRRSGKTERALKAHDCSLGKLKHAFSSKAKPKTTHRAEALQTTESRRQGRHRAQ